MDDLRLNRTAPEPRASRGNARFFVIAIAIAAGLHLVVFGALALTSHHAKPAPALPAPAATPPPAAPIAASAIRAPAASPAEVQAVPAGTEAAPAPRPRPVEHVPVHKHVEPARPVHVVAPVHKKPEPAHKEKAAKARPEKAKPVKVKPGHGKPEKAAKAARHVPAKPAAKPKPAKTLDLDALSKFKSGN